MWHTKYASAVPKKIWDWDLIFGRAVKAISSLGVRSPWFSAWRNFKKNYVLQYMNFVVYDK